jgi:deoxyribodipyrimidine photo-lyase
MSQPTILWFRQDLRIYDNPALHEAIEKGGSIVPIYIHSPDEEGDWGLGGASKWWLHHSLTSLSNDLESIGLHLIIRKGKSLEGLQDLIKETNADNVLWNRRYEPNIIKRDTEIKSKLKSEGIHVKTFNANLLFEPWTIANKQGKPYQVFTPYWKHCSTLDIQKPLLNPTKIEQKKLHLKTLKIEDLSLLPRIHWDEGIKHSWNPGTAQGLKLLHTFIKGPILEYSEERNRPDHEGVSRLSPYLHFGELSPRMIWYTVLEKIQEPAKVEPYLRQLGWREFAHHLLYHFPHTPLKALREEYDKFPWLHDKDTLKTWQKGLTGYPMVDAGMRQLWSTGWMHNRVRMIVGSFLVKDLLLPWQEGAKWFWDTLVDADLANNTLGWQWVAGCGADAAPYFRIFNPVTQGEKFDPDGDYVRRWVPELARLPAHYIHKPWEAPGETLKKSGVVLGVNYPEPIVDHKEARDRALEALKKVSKNIR